MQTVQCVRKVPVKTCRQVCETRTVCCPVTVARQVTEMKPVCVPKTICKQVPVEVCVRVPVTIMCEPVIAPSRAPAPGRGRVRTGHDPLTDGGPVRPAANNSSPAP